MGQVMILGQRPSIHPSPSGATGPARSQARVESPHTHAAIACEPHSAREAKGAEPR
jgi:hypothetical protein